MFSCDLPVVRQNVDAAKRACPGVVTLAGGAHPSALPEGTLQAIDGLDYVIQGEGEAGMEALVRRLGGDREIALDEVPGLAWREEGRVRVNPRRVVADLDALGLPAWDLMEPRLYRDAPQGVLPRSSPVAPISTSRGCPFDCSFCASHVVMGRRIRARSVASVVDEVETLVRRHGVREIHVEDDHFTADKARVLAFRDEVKRRGLEFSLAFPNGVRLDTLDREVLEALKQVGCYTITVGIESGCQRVLDGVHKKLRLPTIREKVQMIHDAGLDARAFFILGFPGESADEMRQTMAFARSLPLSAAQFSNFTPLPATEAAAIVARERGTEALDWERLYYHLMPYVPQGLTPAQLQRLVRQAYLGFYLRPRVVARILGQIRTPGQVGAILRRLRGYLFKG
jgi:radical SAM superfamily enzyme YgiQ (UPF0313 family)